MISTNSKNRIVISAIGFNSSYGTEIYEYFSSSEKPKESSFIIEDYDPQKFLKPKGQRFLSKSTILYCSTAFQAIHSRGLVRFIQNTPERVGLYNGTELSNLEDCFAFDLTAKNEGPDRVSPMKVPNTIANAAASQMAIQAGIKGPNFSVCAGMAGSIQALDIACLHLKQGITDYGIVASTEVRNNYQKSIQKSFGDRNMSPELGISMILERRESMDMENKSPLAGIVMMHSEIFIDHEVSFETYLYSVIRPAITQYDVDILIVSGGLSAIDCDAFEIMVKESYPLVSVLYPENQYGNFDNAGGMFGIAYAISIFNGNTHCRISRKNILILSLDPSGTIIYTIVEKITS
ncbi:beta-ketoacyl synthase N-terminal-like domain-containing protein [Chryseobacterium sp. PMSZPI]|uniref:beta-ketoacyl synthase N-terminal-like domain-containing protein n=1 Tax=Chryseobacterium sp. PMSZPI TaxID=1033900 RepID=UPI000C32D6AD|nr:beta-ketoacyl synthase N-terminal-like domain-containing protein [Chryseobacterium sp. PMSZPI]PKF74863.1 hypothetical protein CW752_07105 [Chryseobacterium sp. PMSZPI]